MILGSSYIPIILLNSLTHHKGATLGLRVWGSGFRLWGLGFRVWLGRSAVRVCGLGVQVVASRTLWQFPKVGGSLL